MIISIDAEKAFDKIQHPSMIKKKLIKNSQQVSIERTYLYWIKAIYGKPITYIVFSREKLKAFLLVRESIPWRVDKKSGVSEEEIGVWNSQGKGKDKGFFPTFLSKDYIATFLSILLEDSFSFLETFWLILLT